MAAQHDKANWLIYGAYGFTGKLIAEEAARRGLTPILAGRNPTAIETLAHELGLPSRAFAIDSAEQVAAALDGVTLVLNCAGPFVETAEILVQACIKRGIHYLDISGEPDVLENLFAYHDQAKASGSVVIPAVGYDVVPSDTLANLLAQRLPQANHLEMAFFGSGAGSAGSAKTVMGMISDKGKVRRKGKIKRVPLAFMRKTVHFSDREEWCMSIPWGDICTAYHSTGIPNITMLMASSQKGALMMRLFSPFAPLLGLPAIRKKLFAKLEASIEGPDREMREQNCMRLWGRAYDDAGNQVEAALDTPEGFILTTQSSLLCVERVLSGNLPGGCYTPVQAFGTELAFEIPGVKIHWRA